MKNYSNKNNRINVENDNFNTINNYKKKLNELQSKQEFNERLGASTLFSSFAFAFVTILITSLTLKGASVFTPSIISMISIFGASSLGTLAFGIKSVIKSKRQSKEIKEINKKILKTKTKDKETITYNTLEENFFDEKENEIETSQIIKTKPINKEVRLTDNDNTLIQ